MFMLFDEFSHSFTFVQISCIRSGLSTAASLSPLPKTEYQTEWRTEGGALWRWQSFVEEGKPIRIQSSREFGNISISSSSNIWVVVVIAELLTWKSDAPCTGEGLWGYGGKVSQCVSVAESTPPRLSDGLEGKHKMLLCFPCLTVKLKQMAWHWTVEKHGGFNHNLTRSPVNLQAISTETINHFIYNISANKVISYVVLIDPQNLKTLFFFYS